MVLEQQLRICFVNAYRHQSLTVVDLFGMLLWTSTCKLVKSTFLIELRKSYI